MAYLLSWKAACRNEQGRADDGLHGTVGKLSFGYAQPLGPGFICYEPAILAHLVSQRIDQADLVSLPGVFLSRPVEAALEVDVRGKGLLG